MATFTERMIGAASLDVRTYEEVEADQQATGQAIAVVVLASVAGGIGSWRLGVFGPGGLILGSIGALVLWAAWAVLTCVIGTRLLPESQTRANVSELMRTLGFAAAPGVLRILGVIPLLGRFVYLATSVWMLATMVVAVRQALDYTSTARAIGVCLVGWLLVAIIAAVLGVAFAPTVS